MPVAAAIQKVQKLMAGRLKRLPAIRSERGPIVSFTFDDFPRSALTVGGKILEEHGKRGTYYASMGLLEKNTAVGQIAGYRDLESLLAAGHELACHTHDHVLSSRVSNKELLANCDRNRAQMADALGGYTPRNFSFPEGVVTLSAKALMSSTYQSCRTIEAGINFDPVDVGFLRANPIYSSSSFHKIKEMIQISRIQAGWLILYTHDISPSPSPWGCTPEEFRAVVASALDSGAEIVTISQALKRFAAVPVA